MKRKLNMPDTDPEQTSFEMPSEKEHLLQVVDIFTQDYDGNKFNLDENTIIAKLEVVGGDEEGRSLLNRLSLDDSWKGFFATRLFLKAIGLECRGEVELETDDFVGRQFYATVVHNESKGKTYANIAEFNFDKMVDNSAAPSSNDGVNVNPEDIAWDE